MSKISIVIPNYNGEKYLDECMDALTCQTMMDFDVIVVDNGSEDESVSVCKRYDNMLSLRIISLDSNYGFARAVNEGIKASDAEYIILLNNDTRVGKHFVEKLYQAIEEDDKIFSVQALMLQYNDRTLVDSAGDLFCALGWAFSVGKDDKVSRHRKKKEIFSACAGAAIYRKAVFEEIGYFDEEFFAYIEDVDIGYRARLHGYYNVLEPRARVLHVGSASSGSRHNAFKVKLAARNSMLVMYKNFAVWQKIVNFLPVCAGIIIKTVYFARKKLARSYIAGLCEFFAYRKRVSVSTASDECEYTKIQKMLVKNIAKRIGF